LAGVGNQKADELLLTSRASGGGFAEVFQHPGFPSVQAGDSGSGRCWWLQCAGGRRRGRSRGPGRANEWEVLKAAMTTGEDVPAPEVCYERVITGVFGDDVKAAG